MTPASANSLNASLLAARMEQSPPSALRDLTARLARGEDRAWAEFHREYGPVVFRQLLGATRGNHELASEALQQTYLRVARHVRPCDAQPMFLSWLRVVARTALSDCRRRRQSFWHLLRRRADEPETDGAENDEALMQAVEHALTLLAAGDRALLEAKYFSGESVRVIADRLQITPKAVESRLTRARAELRQQLSSKISRHE